MQKNVAAILFASLLCAVLLLSAASTYASPADNKANAEAPAVPGQIIVKFKPGQNKPQQLQMHASLGATLKVELPQAGLQVVSLPVDQVANALAAYRNNPTVTYAEPDYLAQGAFTPNDPNYTTSQYAPQKIQADLAWDLSTGSATVVVAVVDSGADFNHPDLQGKLIAGWDFVNNDADPADDNGHGSHISGIIAAATNNSQGIAGIGFNTRVLEIKVLDQYNSGSYSNIAQGIIYAADHGAKIINLSLGGSTASQALQDAVDYAWNQGALVIAAAGNSASANAFYPAAYANALAVSATDPNDNRWSMSNYASYVSVSAPGSNVYSTYLSSSAAYQSLSGTSQSAAVVSGVAALVLAQNGSRSNSQIRSLIESSADDIGPAGRDPYYGFGRVNAYRALTTIVTTAQPTATAVPPTATAVPPTATPVPPTPSPSTNANSMHVSDLDRTSFYTNNNWKGTVTITVLNGSNSPVASANVSGTWRGGISSSGTCTTDSSGKCSLTTGNIGTNKTYVIFTVTNVTKSSFSYQSSANSDPDGDSNGTAITILRP